MKKAILLIFLLVAAATVLFASASAYWQFTAQNATGKTATVDVSVLSGNYAPLSKHTVQLTITGSPTTCTYAFEGTAKRATDNPGTNDFANYSGDIDCSTTGPLYSNGTIVLSVTDKPVSTIRGNLKALSGGTSPTVQLTYNGVQ